MGLETAAAVMAVVAVGAEVAKSSAEASAAQARQSQLKTQGKELEVQTQQKTLQNYEVMEKVLDAQVAHMTTTGTAFSSPSYNAIQRNTLNIGARHARNIYIGGEIAEENIEFEKENVTNTLYAQLFGNAAQAASSVAGAYAKMPTLKE